MVFPRGRGEIRNEGLTCPFCFFLDPGVVSCTCGAIDKAVSAVVALIYRSIILDEQAARLTTSEAAGFPVCWKIKGFSQF